MTLLELKNKFPIVEEIVKDTIYIGHNYKLDKDGYCWMKWEVYIFCRCALPQEDSNTDIEILVKGEGPSSLGMRELRHTYWGIDGGYLYYPNFKYLEDIINWLKQYYDEN